jgi:hypothetical protein
MIRLAFVLLLSVASYRVAASYKCYIFGHANKLLSIHEEPGPEDTTIGGTLVTVFELIVS